MSESAIPKDVREAVLDIYGRYLLVMEQRRARTRPRVAVLDIYNRYLLLLNGLVLALPCSLTGLVLGLFYL
jgi:hypothetical protein